MLRSTRRSAARSRRAVLTLEALESRLAPATSLLTMPYSTTASFDQFTGGAPTLLGFGIDDGEPDANFDGKSDISGIQKAPNFIGVEFNEHWKGGRDYGVAGGNASFDLAGKFGIEYGYYINGGTANAYRDGNVQFQLNEKADGSISINSYVQSESGALFTVSPKISAFADLVLKLDASLKAYGHLFGVGKSIDWSLPSLDTTVPLFAINRQVVDDAGNPKFDTNGKPMFDGQITYVGDNIIKAVGDTFDSAKEYQEARTKAREAEAEKYKAERDMSKSGASEDDVAAAQSRYDAAKTKGDQAEQKEKDLNKKSVDSQSGSKLGLGQMLQVEFDKAEGKLLGTQMNVGLGVGSHGVGVSHNLGSLAVTLPDVGLTDTTIDLYGTLSATTDDFEYNSTLDNDRQLASLKIDVAGLVPGFGKYAVKAGPLEVQFTTLSYVLDTSLKINQSVEMSPAERILTFNFKNDNTGEVMAANVIVDGVRRDNVTSITFNVNQNVVVEPRNTSPIRVEPAFRESYEFTNDIGLNLNLDGKLEVLALKFEAFGYEILDIGPVYELKTPLASKNLGSIFKKTFTISTDETKLNSFVVGGLETDLEVTVNKVTPFISTAAGTNKVVSTELNVFNRGPDPASGVVLTHTLPAGVTFNAAASTAGAIVSGQTVKYNLGNMAFGASRTVTIVVTATNAQTDVALVGTGTVSSLERDLYKKNNTAISETEVTSPKTYVVNTGGDTNVIFSEGDPSNDNLVTLREAIHWANAHPGHDTIVLDGALSSLDVGLEWSYGQLNVTESLTINGNFVIFSKLQHFTRAFRFGGAGANKYLLKGVTIRDTAAGEGSAHGGAILFDDPDDTLTVTDSVFRNCMAGASNAMGGAIFVSGGAKLTVSDSSFINNLAGAGGAVALSQPFWINDPEKATFRRVTFSGNAAYNSSFGGGGAVFIDAVTYDVSGLTTFTNCIFGENTADRGASVTIHSDDQSPDRVTFRNCVFNRSLTSTSTAKHIEGGGTFYNGLLGLSSLGFNRSDDASGPRGAVGDRVNAPREIGLFNGTKYQVRESNQAAWLNKAVVEVVPDPRVDLEAVSFTTGASLSDFRLTYRIHNENASPFKVWFVSASTSSSAVGAGAGSAITVSDPAMLTVGEHVLTFTDTILPFSLVNRNEPFVNAVLDSEFKVEETREGNNVVNFVGAFRKLTAGKGPLVLRGMDSSAQNLQFFNDVISITPVGANLIVNMNGSTWTVPTAGVTEFTILGHGGKDSITIANAITIPAFIDGGNGDDVIVSGGGHDFLFGGNGNDVISGGDGNDVLWGLFGADPITNKARTGPLVTGRDNDTLNGLGGNDRLYGEIGNDSLLGGLGADVLAGGAGNDSLWGANSTGSDAVLDRYFGEAGLDTVQGTVDASDALTAAARALAGIETDVRASIAKVVGPAPKFYGLGKALTFEVHFTTPVNVVGAPYLEVIIGTTKHLARVVGTTGKSMSKLEFSLVVPVNQFDPNGIALLPTLKLPVGASIKDIDGNIVALGFAPPSLTRVLIDSRPPKVAAIKPLGFNRWTRTVAYQVIFTRPVSGVTATSFDVVRSGSLSSASVLSVTGRGAVYTVRMKVGAGRGAVKLRVLDYDLIRDVIGNPLGGLGKGNGNFLIGPAFTVA